MGYEVYLASTLDGPLGIAAALHAAAAVKPDRPCGLATLGLFDRPDPLPALERAGSRCPAAPASATASTPGTPAHRVIPAGTRAYTCAKAWVHLEFEAMTSATAAGASRCTAWPAPATTTTSERSIAPAI